MSINHYLEKIKPFWRLISIVFIAFFILGCVELSAENQNKTPIKIVNMINVSQNLNTDTRFNSSTTVIASKSGKKYYFQTCAGVKRIKLENQITFASPALAEVAGYSLALNCK